MIDIIIPMYNAEKTIDDILKSVINQSYGLWRVIVIYKEKIKNVLNFLGF